LSKRLITHNPNRLMRGQYRVTAPRRVKVFRSYLFLFNLVLAQFLFSCQGSKSTETVFPESQTPLSQECENTKIDNEYIIQWEDGRFQVLNSVLSQSEFIDKYISSNLNDIRHVEYNKQLFATINTAQTHSVVDDVPPSMWGQDIIHSSDLWSKNLTGEGVTVAVIDTQVDISHPSLQNQVAINTQELEGKLGIDDDGNGLIDDVSGWNFFDQTPVTADPNLAHHHGTHVAGIIAAQALEQAPMQGVAPKSKILPITFLSSDGSGSVGGALLGIQYAVQRKVQVINASWGGPNCSTLLEKTLSDLQSKDILFVAASGNEGANLDWVPSYPASYQFDFMMTVAASRVTDLLASFSNTSYHYVHIGAPGDDIYSTVPYGKFAHLSGTSMAAPFVSGAVAVLKSAFPKATPLQIKNALLTGVDRKSYRVLSQGRLNLSKSYQELSTILSSNRP